MYDEYKDLYESPITQTDPLELKIEKDFHNDENADISQEFGANFISIYEKFMESPTFLGLSAINDQIYANYQYEYENVLQKPYIIETLNLFTPETSIDDAAVIVDNISFLCELPKSAFIIRFSDNGAIPILKAIWNKYEDLIPKVITCFAILITNTYSNYSEEILKFAFKSIISNILNPVSAEVTRSSMLFVFSLCKYIELNDKRRRKVKDAIITALQFDDESLYIALWSIHYYIINYVSEISEFAGNRVNMVLLTLLPHRDQNITLIVLEIYKQLIGRPDTQYFTFPAFQVFNRLIELTMIDSLDVSIKSLSVIETAIKNFPSAPEHFLMNGLMDCLSNIIEESDFQKKSVAFIVFTRLLTFAIPEACKDMLNDERFMSFVSFIESSDGKFLKEFAISVGNALKKCDASGLMQEARQTLLKNDIVATLNDILDSVDDDEQERYGEALIDQIELSNE